MTLLEQATNFYSSGLLEQALRAAQTGLAVEPHNEGRLCEVAAASAYALGEHSHAERFWLRAAALRPESADTHYNLGILLVNTGREAQAESCFRRATECNRRFAEAHFCLARCLANRNQVAEAEQSYRKALALNPKLAPAHFCLGLLLFKSARGAEAEKCYRRAIALDAGMVEALCNLGDLLSQSGRDGEAEECFRSAIAINPNFADAHFNLGNLLSAQQRVEESERCYRQAIALVPGFARAHLNLGVLLEKSRRYADAEPCYRQALALEPGLVEGHLNLGALLSRTARPDEAESCMRRALVLDGENPAAHADLGNFLFGRRRYAEAETMFRRAIALDPVNAWLLPLAMNAANYEYTWGQGEADLRRLRELFSNGESAHFQPQALISIAGITALEQKQAGRKHAEIFWKVGAAGAPAARASRRHESLRIGYLSGHFHDHPVSAAIAGVLEAHDKSKMAVHGYSYGPTIDDAACRRIQASCAVFRDLHLMADADAARMIAGDEIDILVDLVGYTSLCRPGIAAARPAPVIVSWLGYPGTLGHERLADYLISDPVVTPLAHASHFSETLALMPHCYLPFDGARALPARPSRQEAGLPEVGFVFCSFNQSYKLNPQTFDVWCRLLREVPGSVLWLYKPSDAAAANLRREAGARGVEPGRVVFAGFAGSRDEHLARLQLADLALDTYPYGSHTTGSDALWAGVPLVTLIGETFASRAAASLLRAVDLPELVAEDWTGYFDCARALAHDVGGLAAVRARLAAARTTAPLFDAASFARDLEALLEMIWQQHLEDGKPAPLVLRGRVEESHAGNSAQGSRS